MTGYVSSSSTYHFACFSEATFKWSCGRTGSICRYNEVKDNLPNAVYKLQNTVVNLITEVVGRNNSTLWAVVEVSSPVNIRRYVASLWWVAHSLTIAKQKDTNSSKHLLLFGSDHRQRSITEKPRHKIRQTLYSRHERVTQTRSASRLGADFRYF